jgi:hypothetical protein
MIRVFTHLRSVSRFRSFAWSSALALAALVTAACKDDEDQPNTLLDPVVDAAETDTLVAADTLTVADARYNGIPFGPFGLWRNTDGFHWGPAPFTGAHDHVFANSLVKQINYARWRRQRLVIAMTGGPRREYMSDGRFDLSKWRRVLRTFNKPEIRKAVAAAVADGTIIGNTMMDEPEHRAWGRGVTKARLDQMAGYVKAIFPTLPVGVNMGPPGYRWRRDERFHRLDYVIYQYNHYITDGRVGAWREAVQNQARRDGVTPAFSLNLLNGGVKDTRGSWDCRGTGGKGTRRPNCRMTADQVRNYGRALGPAGCAMVLWRYDDAFMSKTSNKQAFRDVASTLSSRPRRSCKR